MKACLITTDKDKRGVFMGYVDMDKIDLEKSKQVRAKDVRMAVYWSVRGVVTLAATGPDSESRITKATPSVILDGVTAIMELTPEAEKAWKKEPWG